MRETTYARNLAFSLIELLCVLTIVAILAGMLIPTIQRVRMAAKIATSLSNLRQIGMAISAQLSDNNYTYPRPCDSGFVTDFWELNLSPYLDAPEIMVGGYPKISTVMTDPLLASDHHNGWGDYGCNTDLFRFDWQPPKISAPAISHPSDVISVMTAQQYSGGFIMGCWFSYTAAYIPAASYPNAQAAFRANGKTLAVFCDGHVEGIDQAAFVSNRVQYLLH